MNVYRARVVTVARSQVGATDPTRYWLDVLPNTKPPFPRSWCGAGYLWCLHQAGLALDVNWVIGLGLAGAMSRSRKSFPVTFDPAPGDMAYFTRHQHHAVVVGREGDQLELVNFNGHGGTVTVTRCELRDVRACYSIENLIPNAAEQVA